MKFRKAGAWIAVSTLIAAAIAAGIVNPGGGGAGTCTSVSQFGVSWSFNKAVPCGQFVNGDYWVTPASGDSTVTITGISPAFSGGKNGYEVNPSGGEEIGLDNTFDEYNAAKVPALPYAANTGSSIIKGVSKTNGCGNDAQHHYPCLSDSSVLTVLATAPPSNGANTFRPAYAGTDKTLFSSTGMRTDLLPSLAPVAGGVTLAQAERRYDRPQVDHLSSWVGRYLHAYNAYAYIDNPNPSGTTGDVSEYGSEIANDSANVALRLMLNDSVANKTPALINYVQAGIDFWGMHKAGVSWYGDGGHMQGRKLPAVFASVMLDSTSMKNEISNATYGSYGEDYHMYVSGSTTAPNGVLFGKVCGAGEYNNQLATGSGPRDCRDPDGAIDGGDLNNEYQACCLSMPFKYTSLAARLLPGAQTVWNYAPFFQYVDRWVSSGWWHSPDPRTPDRWPSTHGTQANTGGYQVTFGNNMWNAYR